MNTNEHLTRKQALRAAYLSAGIENDGPVCLAGRYDGGFYHFVVRTLFLRYEFYVDAANGEVPGISTEPLPYEEELHACSGEKTLPSVA